ncbi:prepilin peptidase [Ammoniphilus resinae]|uniref:Leader peptidase (Prepilin peptidase)/N-methyltransferase n=1 Tax=Ammoniphilus resinae TaxID=861532 RepID=A0ABS4GIY9_9BACL|nr:A24 family peptidase [Ammoniphilus resinae]MBP1930228.1 leader peptidase (prepilin peptidase)/N-methyltransferase [Ammoniphilus resinae]
MEIIQSIFIIIFSLILSSFLNVVAIRIPKGESIVFPASHCVHCKHPLKPHDLVPVFSYLLLKGRCRYCQTKISPVYLLGEVFTTCVFVFAFYQIGWNQELWIAIPLMALLTTITISDLLYKIIPNKVNLFFFVLFALIHVIYRPLPFTDYLIGVIAGGGLLLLIAIISRGGMGGGDIKLMAVVGLAIGWKLTLLSFFLASLIGGIIGVLLLAIKVVKRKEPIPFGPFLALGIWLSYFYGNELISAYIKFALQ